MKTEADFQAEMDMDTLARAQEIAKTPGRVAAARSAAMEKREQIDQFLKDTGGQTKPFNGSPRKSFAGKRRA